MLSAQGCLLPARRQTIRRASYRTTTAWRFRWRPRISCGSGDSVLSGLDTLVFAGAIGENAPAIRAGLEFLGIEIEKNKMQKMRA
jgi:acetate kinase